MQRIFFVLRWVFFQLPFVSTFVLAAFGIAIIFMKELDKCLEHKTALRWTLAIVVIAFGVLAWLSDRTQFSIEKSASMEERKLLQGQIGQLISASQIQATSDDIQKLDAHMTEGFATVVAAIRGVKAAATTTPQQKVGPQLPPALVQNLTFTQRRAPSSAPSLPYGLQIIIQSNITIQPVGFAFVCDGEVGKVQFFIAGQGAYLNVQTGIAGEKKNIGYVRFSFPPLQPETPLVVTLLSKGDIRVTEVQQMH